MDEELIRRQEANESFLKFCEIALAPLGHKPAKHHRLMIEELAKVERGETRNLMLFMPPGSAKSTYASTLFPAWFMARKRRRNVIGASNVISLAEDFSRKVQGVIVDNRLLLDAALGRESAERWNLTNGSTYAAVGVGGSIRGVRADLTIIDDPVKSAADVASAGSREGVWTWFNADIVSRGGPSNRIVLVMTRYHEDDLAGRLLAVQDDTWRVVNLPMTAVEGDPLGRRPGALLWDDDEFGYAKEMRQRRKEAERKGMMRDWNAQYEQDPRPGEGGIFDTAALQFIDVPPVSFKREFRAWDLAATAQTGGANPDWTVGLRMGETPEGRFVISNVTRLRGTPEQVVHAILDTALMDGPKVRVSLPQDPGQAGKAQVLFLTQKLRGYAVQSSPETGDKATRAAPFASQVNVGNVDLVRGGWNAAYVEELSWFPAGKKDDQVDASSRAFASLTAAPAPARWAQINVMGR